MTPKKKKPTKKQIDNLCAEMLNAIADVMNAARPREYGYGGGSIGVRLAALDRLNQARLHQHELGVYLDIKCEQSDRKPVGGHPYPTVEKIK